MVPANLFGQQNDCATPTAGAQAHAQDTHFRQPCVLHVAPVCAEAVLARRGRIPHSSLDLGLALAKLSGRAVRAKGCTRYPASRGSKAAANVQHLVMKAAPLI